tara:strand:+ start:97 stop:765 length:669 start_codon:yes stop_codon:yes gene_type:complete
MKLFIDCGVNRGQSIWAFSEYMKDNSSWDYIGFEPAIGGLNNNSMQVNEMRTNLKKWGGRYNSVKLIPKAVGSKDTIRIFWWSYGAGSTGLFSMAIRMFFRDLFNFKFKKSLRFFRFNLIRYCDIVEFVKNKKNKGYYVALKLDVEGAEFEILEKMYKLKIFPDQLMIEYHAPKIGYPIKKLKELHKNIFDMGVEIFLWGAEFGNVEPPMKKLGRILSDEDC